MKRILIVDDEEKIREVLKLHLKKKDYKIVEAENGKEAIEELNREQYSLMICDIKMPQKNGLEVLEFSKKNFKTMPVIMLTGYVELDTAINVMKKGAYDYLTKPLKKNDLYIAVEKAVEYGDLLKEKEELRKANLEYQRDLEKKVKERTVELEKQNLILELKQKELEESYKNLKKAQDNLIRSERLAVIGEMAAEISHELNNYLSVLVGRAQMLPVLIQKDLKEKALESSSIILKQVQKMNRFTLGLVDSAAMNTMKKQCNVNDVIVNVVEFIKPQNKYDYTKFVLDLDKNIPGFLVDGEQFQQILMNLYSNAAAAIKEGNIFTKTELLKEEVVITIKDDGPGIPGELAEKIFIPGFSTREDGHGFGLSVSQRIVENHNGKLELVEDDNSGATFRITLPIQN
ncbi:response regulator [candidate division KSB1 bacterium]